MNGFCRRQTYVRFDFDFGVSGIDLSVTTVFLMEGCGVLGTVYFPLTRRSVIKYFGQGGGGSPYSTYLICKEVLRSGQVIRVVDHTSLPQTGVLARGC